MVALRLCAETSVFVILLALPLVLLLLGKFWALSFTCKLIVSVLGLSGLVMLPVYGFITFKVTVTGDELTTHAVFSRHSCSLATVKGLARRSNWNWIRYVVEFEGGELTFPIWLKNCDDLVQLVRAHIPSGEGGKRSVFGRQFTQDPVSLIFQIGQATAGLIFMGVIWFFAASLYHSGTAGISSTDELLVIVFAFIISSILLWRTIVVALMPIKVQVKNDELLLQTFFFEKKLTWKEIKTVKEPFPLLPEGFMIHTSRGLTFLIGNGMDSADELADSIKEKAAAAL